MKEGSEGESSVLKSVPPEDRRLGVAAVLIVGRRTGNRGQPWNRGVGGADATS